MLSQFFLSKSISKTTGRRDCSLEFQIVLFLRFSTLLSHFLRKDSFRKINFTVIPTLPILFPGEQTTKLYGTWAFPVQIKLLFTFPIAMDIWTGSVLKHTLQFILQTNHHISPAEFVQNCYQPHCLFQFLTESSTMACRIFQFLATARLRGI